MKVGMNSQTLRIVKDDSIIDYNINDGSTATKFMKVIDGYLPKDLESYGQTTIQSLNDPMSWGTPVDKMTDIGYTEVGGPVIREALYPSPINYHMATTRIYNPITAPTYPQSSTTRGTFSQTTSNETNFKKLFSK